MPVRLEFDPEAAREVEAIFDWYEQRRPGLGSDFAAQLDQDLALLIENPRMAPPWRGPASQQLGVRASLMGRYPFVLPYLPGRNWSSYSRWLMFANGQVIGSVG